MRRAEHADGREKCRIQIKTKKNVNGMVVHVVQTEDVIILE